MNIPLLSILRSSLPAATPMLSSTRTAPKVDEEAIRDVESTAPVDVSPTRRGRSKRTAQQGMFEIRQFIGEHDKLLPENSDVTELTRVNYQSRTYRAAAFQHMQDRYGSSDRHVYIISHNDNKVVFVIHGKVSGSNPWEVMHATLGAADFRNWNTTVYVYDGKDTLTAYPPGEKPTVITGEWADPNKLLTSIDSSMGTAVSIEEFLVQD